MELIRRPIIAAICVIAATSASAERPLRYGGAMRVALYGEPAAIDPVLVHSHAETTINRLIFDCLYVRVADGEVQPHLAAALPVASSDGRSVYIELRKGVVFHDGTVLRPTDVASSLRRLMQSRAGNEWLLADVRRIEATADGINLTLVRRIDELARRLSTPPTAIVRAGAGPTWERIVGTGPYRFSAIGRAEQVLRIASHSRHFAGRPFLDELELRWYADAGDAIASYELGELQLVFDAESRFVGHRPKFASTSFEVSSPLLVYLGASNRVPAALVRSLSLAIDRRAFSGVARGDRVVPTANPVDHERKSRVLPRVGQARRDLAAARLRDPKLDSLLKSASPLDIVYERGRTGERDAAERVLAALFRLRIAGRVRGVSRKQFIELIASDKPLVYVDHLTSPWHPTLGHGYEAYGRMVWRRGDGAAPPAAEVLTEELADARFAPLYYRFLRLFHRADYHGLESNSDAFASLPDLFQLGEAKRLR